ncbi:MAG: cytochrome c biogenesis protein CcsA, partial [Gammaproteobacteria bacterium]|nr:cytochrome c biogenesis protein CcsA [Gammaproteobacteria bacterium]
SMSVSISISRSLAMLLAVVVSIVITPLAFAEDAVNDINNGEAEQLIEQQHNGEQEPSAADVGFDGFTDAVADNGADNVFDYGKWALLPVQHQGRIKPLDSFARIHLKIFAHREKLQDIDAKTWLAEAVFNPDKSYSRPLFKIRHLHNLLDLPSRDDNLYSFYQISSGLGQQLSLVEELVQKDYNLLSATHQELVDLSHNSLIFFDISRSLSLFAPIFIIRDTQLASYLGVTTAQPFNYLKGITINNRLVQFIEDTLQGKNKQQEDNAATAASPASFTPTEIEALAFANLVDTLSNDKKSILMKVLPGQWSSAWTSPWENIDRGDGTPDIARLFAMWQELMLAYSDGDSKAWNEASGRLLDDTLLIAGESSARSSVSLMARLQMELLYNKAQLFLIGMLLYMFASFVAVAYLLFKNKKTTKGLLDKSVGERGARNIILTLIGGGVIVQCAGIIIRMLILNRPPVSDFYESLLFVMVIVVSGGFLLEILKRNYWGITVACSSGILLSLLGFYYQGRGDSMQMLIAVLNTNYWLATHVIVITMGYAASISSAILAHTYLAKHAFHLHKFGTRGQWNDLQNYILGSSLIALFLMLMGTILGGIWADQSWGRFWGWDPKENGALLIILWLILMIHSRMTSFIKPHIFAAGMVVLNIVVALSWFGVNLLNVGLHSYGFIDNKSLVGLTSFVGLEVVYIAITLGGWRLLARAGARTSGARA